MQNQKHFRLPTQEEIDALFELHSDMLDIDHHCPDLAAVLKRAVAEAYIVVFDRYIARSVEYRGKLMVVVWAAAPTTYEAYTWANGKLVREWQYPSVFALYMPRRHSTADNK